MRTFILPAILCWLAMLVAYPLAPVAVTFATPDGRLPWWAWWLETHDNLGWAGPLSEGYPASKWGLCRWLWRNKAYAFRNQFRADPSETELMYKYSEVYDGAYFRALYKVGPWFLREYGLKFKRFKIWIAIGWKLKPYYEGPNPTGPTASGILIPISMRTDDYVE